MTSDWKPNAPDVKISFTYSTKTKSKQKEKTKPVSIVELNKLEAERERVQPELRPLLIPAASRKTSKIAPKTKETKIQAIKRQLRRRKGRAKKDFDRSR